MTTPDTNHLSTSYVAEYRAAFVPYTSEDETGTITDAYSGAVVELPATHPEYRQRYGEFAGVQAVHNSFNQVPEA